METEQTKKVKEKAKEMYRKILEKRTEIEKAETGRFVTDGRFQYGNNTAVIVLGEVKSVSAIVDMYAFLLEKSSFSEKASKDLEVKTPEFTWRGAGLKDWLNDFSIRITQLTMIEKKRNLAEAETAILKIVEKDFLDEIKMEEISKTLDL